MEDQFPSAAWDAVILPGFALAMSRRSLGIALGLVLVALAFMAYDAILWLRPQ